MHKSQKTLFVRRMDPIPNNNSQTSLKESKSHEKRAKSNK